MRLDVSLSTLLGLGNEVNLAYFHTLFSFHGSDSMSRSNLTSSDNIIGYCLVEENRFKIQLRAFSLDLRFKIRFGFKI